MQLKELIEEFLLELDTRIDIMIIMNKNDKRWVSILLPIIHLYGRVINVYET